MRFKNRWSRAATACAAGALALGLGTVAAQSQQETWWHSIFQSGPIFGQSEFGEVTITPAGPAPYNVMSGNLGRARQSFSTTGEYIGCQVFTDITDGQFITCAARDAAGNTAECTTIFAPSEFALREHMLLNAALNLTDSHFVAIQSDPLTGYCLSLQVLASSADFLADGESSSETDCTLSNSVDLGVFGGSPISVPNNACVKVTQFADWPYGPNRTMQVQSPSGTAYPVPYTYEQSCTGASGSGQIDAAFDDQYLPGLSDACPLFIKLQAGGSGAISLRYW